MLNILVSFIKGLGTKTLIILIILSFALWGVGDIFTGNENPTIATVGNSKIKLNEFNLEYQTILQRLRATSNEPLTDEFVKAMGLHETVLNNLINQKYLNMISSQLEIIIGENYLKKSILNNPMFKDQLGVFNKDYFTYYLNQNNLSEKELLSISKNVLTNDLLVQSLDSAAYIPSTITENFFKKVNAQRKADIYYFDASAILIKEKISDETIIKKYEEVKNNFLNPEARSFRLIKLDKNKIRNELVVKTEEIDEVYQINKGAYEKKELRKVYQPLFETKSKAEEFKELSLKIGFFDALKEYNINKDDTFLGEIKKDDLSKKDESIVFNLKSQELSKIYKSSFGYKLFYINEVVKSQVLSETEIKAEIKKDLLKEELFNKMYQQADKIFEDFLLDNNIEKAIDNKNLIINNFEKITLNNIDGVFENINIKIPIDQLSKVIFNTSENEISDLIEDKEENIYFVYIDKITAPTQKTLAEIKDSILEIIYDEKKEIMIKDEATIFLEKVQKNSNKVNSSQFSNLEYVKTDWLSLKNSEEIKIQPIVKDMIFKTKINNYSNVTKIDKLKFVIVKPFEQKEKTKISKDDKNIQSNIVFNLKNSISADVIDAILFDLKSKTKKSINKNFLNSF